jgi:hypothetical protein
VTTNGALGKLRQGLPAVRITNRTSVCVASDSKNHPVWKSFSSKWKNRSSTKNVKKSYSELTGPVRSMKFRMSPMSQRWGRRT